VSRSCGPAASARLTCARPGQLSSPLPRNTHLIRVARALGEDYNILVMTRIREEAGRVPLRQAVPRALERTGSTVTSAGLVLAGTFGVFALVEGSQPGGGPYRAVLASLALGILMDAFLVRTLLVPSTVALLGRWNWWPSDYGSPAAAVSSSPRLAETHGR
jgi:uncharacterized membrane protein YdfJ with MMPL/SSD domain